MKITQKKLQQIIKEEVQAALYEALPPPPPGAISRTPVTPSHWPPGSGRGRILPRGSGPMAKGVPGPKRAETLIDRAIKTAKKTDLPRFKNLSKHFSEKLSFGSRFNTILAALLLTGDSEPPMELAVQKAIPYIQKDPTNLMNPAQALAQAEAAYEEWKQKLGAWDPTHGAP